MGSQWRKIRGDPFLSENTGKTVIWSFMKPWSFENLTHLKSFLEQGRVFITHSFTHFIIQPTNQLTNCFHRTYIIFSYYTSASQNCYCSFSLPLSSQVNENLRYMSGLYLEFHNKNIYHLRKRSILSKIYVVLEKIFQDNWASIITMLDFIQCLCSIMCLCFFFKYLKWEYLLIPIVYGFFFISRIYNNFFLKKKSKTNRPMEQNRETRDRPT